MSEEKNKATGLNNPIQEKPKTQVTLRSKAAAAAGEVAYSGISVLDVLSPVILIKESFGKLILSLKSIFKNKKRLILIGIIALLWIIFILLPVFGINPLPVKILSFLTFAQGGISMNPLRVIGGVIGKGVFAIFFLSLFDDGLKRMKGAFPKLLSSFKTKSVYQIGLMLTGVGLSLILYNFMAGYAALIKAMVGVASLMLILETIGTEQGFIIQMTAALTAKQTPNGKVSDEKAIQSLLTGLTTGFAFGVLLSLVPFGYTPYIAGAAAFPVGVVFVLVFKNKEAKQ